MLLREKGKPDGPAVGMGWDEAQAALQAGTHKVAEGGRAGDDEAGPGEESAAGLAPEDEVDAQTKADLAAALRRG